MTEIIDFEKHLRKREEDNLKLLKETLEIEIQKLDYDIEKELTKFVIFDTSNYYSLVQDNSNKVSLDKTMKLLLTAFDMLVKLDKQEASLELENIITRLENNSYEK